MKRILCFIIMVLVIIMPLSACSEEIPEDTAIKLMTFNIRTLAVEDDSINNWSNRKTRVLETILKYDADLIGFQELTNPQYTYLRENLTAYGFYGIDRTGGTLGESPAIFYKKDRFTVIETSTIWLSETPDKVSIGWDASTYRTCTIIKFKDLLTGKEFTHYNTHFDHKDETARAGSADLLLDRISAETSGILLTGDFNLDEGSDIYNNLISETLKDTKYLAPEGSSDTGATFHGFTPSDGTLPIDFIFVNDSYYNVLSYKILRDINSEGYYPSDHYPVITELQYK